jgi:RNA recognition motif-containing protein
MSSATEVCVPQAAAAINEPTLVKNKVFVGNLSFRTKESELAKFLEEAGNV